MKHGNVLQRGVAAACMLGAVGMLPGCSKLDQTLGKGPGQAGEGGEGGAGTVFGRAETSGGGGELSGVDGEWPGGAPGLSSEPETGGTQATGGTRDSSTEPTAAGSSREPDTGAAGAMASAGETGVGGSTETGGETGSGGRADSGGTTGSGGGSTASRALPCDIYAAAETPCVAAYSMVRLLSSTYGGPLYQVRKGGGKTGTGGTTRDIASKDGFGDAAAQDAFCGSEPCTVSMLYDQSGTGNDLVVAERGCYEGTASEGDYESDAKGRSLTVSGHAVYALEMQPHEGYRNNHTVDMPTGSDPQGIYEVADGKRVGAACCWDFGNSTKDNCYGPSGSTNAIFFGTAYWGHGAGSGPWFMGDFDGGVWSGGSGVSNAVNPENPSMAVDYAFGILKSRSDTYTIRTGDAQSGSLVTAYDGPAPAPWQMQGGIILGIGSDNSNSSYGTFFEGVITSGRPGDATDEAILRNVQAARYGK